MPAGHGFQGYDPNTGEVIRGHCREMTPERDAVVYVSINQEEHAAGDLGPLLDPGPLVIHIDTVPVADLTGPQARRLASLLLEAAELWDTLQ